MQTPIITFLCFLSMVVNAQNRIANFQLGESYEIPKFAKTLDFFGDNDQGFANLYFNGKEAIIYRFDPKTLTLTNTEIIPVPSVGKYHINEGVIKLGKNYYWLYSNWEKKEEKEKIYYNKIDLSTGKFLEANVLMFETSRVDGILINSMIEFTKSKKYTLVVDAEKKCLLVISQPFIERGVKINTFFDKRNMYVFNANMHQLSGGEYQMPYVYGKMRAKNFCVDGTGNIYAFLNVNDSTVIDRNSPTPQFHFEILTYEKGNKEPTFIKLPKDTFFNAFGLLSVSKDLDIQIGGAYATATSFGCEGFYVKKVASKGKLLTSPTKYYKFSEEEMTRNWTYKTDRQTVQDLRWHAQHLTVRNVAQGLDNSLTINCEVNYRGQTTRTSPTAYMYDDLMTAKIDSNENLVWFKNLPKGNVFDYEVTDDYGTFTHFNDHSNSYYIYMHGKVDLNEERIPTEQHSVQWPKLLLTKIDDKGNVAQDALYNEKDDLVFLPGKIFDLGNNEFIGIAWASKTTSKPFRITVK